MGSPESGPSPSQGPRISRGAARVPSLLADHDRPNTGSARGQQVLLVAYCDGNRCARLRRLRRTHHATDARRLPARSSAVLGPLRLVIRSRPRSLLLSTPCLGHCDQAPIAALVRGLLTETGAKMDQPTRRGGNARQARADYRPRSVDGDHRTQPGTTAPALADRFQVSFISREQATH